MKKVRIVNGMRRIEDSDAHTALFKLRDVLMEHRSVLITRLISDLAAYIDYKFSARPNSRQLESIREHLYSLKNSALDLERYHEIIDHFHTHDVTYIASAPFFREIDESIGAILNASQLSITGPEGRVTR